MTALRFLLRRAFYAILLLFAVSLLTFLFLQLAPGDFLSEMKLNPQISAETIAGLRQQYGLDDPFPVRYVRWLKSVTRGEFGHSFAYNQPVAPLLWERGRNTLLLSISAMAITWLVAIPIGLLTAARRNKWPDRVATAGTIALHSLPDLLIALLLLMLAVRTSWFATGGMLSLGFAEMTFGEKLKDVIYHFTLPVLALVLGNLPVLVRHVHSAVSETLEAPFVRVLRAHGIPEWRVLFRHVLPVSANPLLSLFGVSFGVLLSQSLIVEVVMTWPGLGPLLLEAVFSRDLYVLIGVVLASTFLLVLGTLVADCVLLWADPRIRRESAA